MTVVVKKSIEVIRVFRGMTNCKFHFSKLFIAESVQFDHLKCFHNVKLHIMYNLIAFKVKIMLHTF